MSAREKQTLGSLSCSCFVNLQLKLVKQDLKEEPFETKIQVTFPTLIMDLKGSVTFEKLSTTFQIRSLQSASIFSILNHPCSFMGYYRLFDVFVSFPSI